MKVLMTRRQLAVAALALVAACGQVFRPAEPDRRLHLAADASRFELDVGYRFVALPEPTSSVVRLVVQYPVGSADDPPGKQGLAHLVQHVLADAAGAQLGRVALTWDAETGPDTTTYSATALAGSLDELIGIEAERLGSGCTGITPESFEHARQVVADELRQRQQDSAAEILHAALAQIYPVGHPYRASETAESVASLALADACAFLAGPYLRGSATVVASGAVDDHALRAAAAAHLNRLTTRTQVERPPLSTPGQPAAGTTRIPAAVAEPTLVLAWPLPTATTRDYRRLEMVWRMFPYAFETAGLQAEWGHGALAEVLGGPRAPVLVVSIALASPGKLDAAIAGIQRAIKETLRSLELEDQAAWERLREAQAEDLLSRWESLETRNELAAELIDDDTASHRLSARTDELTDASPASAHEIASDWLAHQPARYLLFEPNGATSVRLPIAIAASEQNRNADAQAAQLDPARADHPVAIGTPRLTLDVDHYRLSNGLTMVMLPSGSSPLVHTRLVVGSGVAREPEGLEGLSTFVSASALSPDSMVFAARALSTLVDETLEHVTLVLRAPTYHLSDHDKAFLRARLLLPRASAVRDYDHALAAAVYGADHPYARTRITEASLQEMSTDDVAGWVRRTVVPANTTLIVTGKFSPGLAEQYVKYDADQVASGTAAPPITAAPHPERRFVRGIDAQAAPTGPLQLDIELAGARGLDAAYAKRLVLAQILAARLNTLRGGAHLAYGFAAAYEPHVAGGLWHISGEVDAARAAEATAAIAAILADLRRDPETYRRELVLARQQVLAGLLLGATDSREVANRLTLMVQFHLPETYFDQLAREVAALTLPDLQALVTAELSPAHQVFGAFGQAAAVDAALAVAKASP